MWQLSQFTVVRDLAERDLITHNLVFNTSTNKCIVISCPLRPGAPESDPDLPADRGHVSMQYRVYLLL
jgi:hypothetical protein